MQGSGRLFFPELSGQAFKVCLYVLLCDLLAVRLFMPALGLLPWGGRGGVDASELLGRIFAIDVPDMLQKRNNVRFLLQRGLAAAGMFYGRVGRLILVFMINGREYRTGRPGFHPFIDQETASPVQMPPVRQNDQMVQFDGRQDESLGVRLLNEPVAEFLRGSGVCHAEMGCLYYKRPQVFLNTKSACSSSALAVGIGKWLCGIRQVPGMLLPAPQAECLKIWRRLF